MDNQHRKISGYRELSQQEIDLMNRIKAKGTELLELQAELDSHLRTTRAQLLRGETASPSCPVGVELARFEEAEPLRWAAIGKIDIQTGIMALVRAVAQPGTC